MVNPLLLGIERETKGIPTTSWDSYFEHHPYIMLYYSMYRDTQ